MLRIGCCGFPVGLSRYARELPVAEVQKTFYRIPKMETARRWRDTVPKDFVFTMKAWQGITHPAGSPTYRKAGIVLSDDVRDRLGYFRPTEPVFEGWERTREVAEILTAPVILLQTPPSFQQTPENEGNLRGFLSGIDRGDSRIALETRAPWDLGWLATLCREFDLVHCVDPFREAPVTAPPFYLRLHGSPPGNRMYTYHYTGDDLRWLRDWIAGREGEGEVYCLFNNLSMWQDACTFRDLLVTTRGGAGPSSGPE
jgi:uncharacterized protein YecE (DUF72 family)